MAFQDSVPLLPFVENFFFSDFTCDKKKSKFYAMLFNNLAKEKNTNISESLFNLKQNLL